MESNRKNLVLTDMHIRMCPLLRRLKDTSISREEPNGEEEASFLSNAHGVLHSKTTSKIQILDKNAFLSTGCNTALAFRSLSVITISHTRHGLAVHTLLLLILRQCKTF